MSAVKFGSNIASLSAQRRLSDNTRELSTVFERLSSGLRINRAADDAAGLSISESLRSDARVFKQGIRNFNDGVSLLNIADAAVESLTGIVIRLKELAEQSANGTYSSTQRSALNKEAQSLSKEYARIAQSTKFNGVSLLGGGLNELRIQGGYGANGGINSNLGGAIGNATFSGSTVIYNNAASGDQTSEALIRDVNQDGIMDIVAAYTADVVNGAYVGVTLGAGNGTFMATRTYGSFDSAAATGIEVGDIDNDGIYDIMIGGSSDLRVSVLRGVGDGTFAAAGSYLMTATTVDQLEFGDFNGDGFGDMAALRSGFGVVIRHGTGTGTFGAATTYSNAVSSGMAVGDVNNDGLSDLVLAGSSGSGRASIYFGSASGSLSAPISYVMDAVISSAVKLGDVNNDGFLDVVTAGRVSAAPTAGFTVRLGSASGVLGDSTSYTMGGTGLISSLELSDINGDGNLDVLGGTNIFARLGSGSGTFAADVSLGINIGVYTSGDVNGDGVQDLVISHGGVYEGAPMTLKLGNSTRGTSALLPFDLSTKVGARSALGQFDTKLRQLAVQRGQIGAFQSRLGVGLNTLTASMENYSAAESRIRDADVAEESSKLIRLNILQRAASSVLAQANQQPQVALKLLGA